MKETLISYTKYKVVIEAISDFCVSANQNFTLESSDYLIKDGFAYVIENSSVLKMFEDGIISEKELENIKNFLQANPEYLQKYFGDFKLELADNYGNNLTIIRFWRFLELEDSSFREIYAIPASTIKGILKTGFLSFFLDSVNYRYRRVGEKKKLELLALKPNGLQEEVNSTQQLYQKLIAQKEIKDGIQLFELTGENNWEKLDSIENLILHLENLLFKNLICSDAKLLNGRFLVKKVNRISRMNNRSAALQYLELAQKDSVFEGEVKEANHLKDLPVSMLSFLYEDLNYTEDLSLIDICKEGLRKLSEKMIKAEQKHFAQKIGSLNSQNSGFYNNLLNEVRKGEIVIKIGRSGIHAKSFMSFDSNNLSKQDFFPYTINVDDKEKLPVGWVKIRIDEADEI